MVAVLIPAHDEAGRVGEVVKAVVAHGLAVLVVDDGSRDATAEEARCAGAQVLRLEPNQGKGAALKAGLGQLLAEGAQAVVTLDADGQHDADYLPRFLEVWRARTPDLVVGARDFRGMPPVRRLTNTVARLLFSGAVGTHVPDNQSGYRLLSRRLARAALDSPESGFAFEVEVLSLCIGRGYRVEWIPIPTLYGDERSDIRPWTHLTSFLRVTVRAYRSVRRERERAPRRQ